MDSQTATPLHSISYAVEGAADGVAEGIQREGLNESLPRLAGKTAPIVRRGLGPRAQRLRSNLEHVDQKVERAVGNAREKARAVAETARRARHAPPAIWADLRGAAKAWTKGIASAAGMGAAAGVVAIAAAILLTAGFVQGLNRLWGQPWGTFTVAVVYGVAALILLSVTKARARRGQERARNLILDAREEVRKTVRPLKSAFTRTSPTVPQEIADAILSDATLPPSQPSHPFDRS